MTNTSDPEDPRRLLQTHAVPIAKLGVHVQISQQRTANIQEPVYGPEIPVAKIFFNNKGAAAKETDNCANYPPDDESVWTGEADK